MSPAPWPCGRGVFISPPSFSTGFEGRRCVQAGRVCCWPAGGQESNRSLPGEPSDAAHTATSGRAKTDTGEQSDAVPPRSRRKKADEKQGTATRIQNLSMPSQRDGPRPAGRAAWQSQRRRTAAQQAATPIRKRPIQNPSMPCQRRGPRPARTGGTATRMRPPPKRQRKPFRPGRPIAARCKARAASRKTSVNRIAQVAPTGRWPALCESGPGRTEHRHFLHTSAVFAASCAAAKPVLLFKSC